MTAQMTTETVMLDEKELRRLAEQKGWEWDAFDRAVLGANLGPLLDRLSTLEAEKKAALEALRPFAALAAKRDAHYRKRGGNPDSFPDTHPAYDIAAADLPMGVWRTAARTLTESTNVPEASHDH